MSLIRDGTIEFTNKGPPEIGPHEITYLDKINAGCFGTVYRGLCRGKEVAIKKLFRQDLTTKTLEDFRKEIEICSALHHPNVVLFMGACTTPGHMAIVTELMPKGNLQSVLHDKSLQLSLYMRLKFAKDTALGINWLHCSTPQIIHRDLKPSNLLLDANNVVKVCDFGLSAVKNHDEMIRDTDSIPGTPLWMAPEVMMGQPLDEKSDVYSFGIVLWEIITSKEPFLEFDSYPAFKRAICREDVRPPLPKDISPSLRKLMESCWDKNPKNRPSFADIIKRLDDVVCDATIVDPIGNQFWKKHFLGTDQILYSDFIKVFADEILHLQVAEDLNFDCLRHLIPTKEHDKTKRNPPLVVTAERFGLFLSLFGPLDSKNTILEKIKLLMRQPWFHGDISAEEAEKVLATHKTGSFLVRMSKNPGFFTISKISRENRLNHQRIEYKNDKYTVAIQTKKGKKTVTKDSLIGLIGEIKNDLYLKSAASSPFESLFARAKTALDGYAMCDSDVDSE